MGGRTYWPRQLLSVVMEDYGIYGLFYVSDSVNSSLEMGGGSIILQDLPLSDPLPPARHHSRFPLLLKTVQLTGDRVFKYMNLCGAVHT